MAQMSRPTSRYSRIRERRAKNLYRADTIPRNKRPDTIRAMRGWRHNNARWHKIAKAWRKSHPLCNPCQQKGFTTAATEVDHIVAVFRAPDRMFDTKNIQSICYDCHIQKTRTEVMLAQEKRRKSKRMKPLFVNDDEIRDLMAAEEFDAFGRLTDDEILRLAVGNIAAPAA